MARVVKEMPASTRGSKYPWASWFDGKVWELTPGTDFDCNVDSMRQQAYQAAANAGVSVTTRERDGLLYIQTTEKKKGK